MAMSQQIRIAIKKVLTIPQETKETSGGVLFLEIEWESAERVHKGSCLSQDRVSVDLHTGCADEIISARKKRVTSNWGVPFVRLICPSTFVTEFGISRTMCI